MQKPCTKLKVNKPCHWLAGFVYLLLANNRVCLSFVNQWQGLFTLSLCTRIQHVERPYSLKVWLKWLPKDNLLKTNYRHKAMG